MNILAVRMHKTGLRTNKTRLHIRKDRIPQRQPDFQVQLTLWRDMQIKKPPLQIGLQTRKNILSIDKMPHLRKSPKARHSVLRN